MPEAYTSDRRWVVFVLFVGVVSYELATHALSTEAL